LTSCADRGNGAAEEAAPVCSAASADSSAWLAVAGPEAQDAVAAARSGLRKLLDALPAHTLDRYGFADRGEVERAALAPPYRVWTTDAQASAVAAAGEWRFPVTVDGGYRALLTVARVDGEWRAVDLGAAALSRELAALERDRGVAPGTRRVLLRLPALRADLAAFPGADARVEEAPFEPLASARALESGPRSAIAPKDLLPWARQRVEAARSRR
jgi:hypothetical protein